MPTYEYLCTECGQNLEVVQAFTDDALTECPKCGGKLRKVFGNVGVTFKGSGFYKTDSRKSPSSPAAAKAEPKESTTEASPSSSSDSKADSKSDSSKPSTEASKPSTSTSDKAAS